MCDLCVCVCFRFTLFGSLQTGSSSCCTHTAVVLSMRLPTAAMAFSSSTGSSLEDRIKLSLHRQRQVRYERFAKYTCSFCRGVLLEAIIKDLYAKVCAM